MTLCIPMTQYTPPPKGPNAERGMALIFALLVLVALMLAGAAMVKVVSNSSQIAGNLSFRQDALMTSERATQIAIGNMSGVLIENTNGLNNSNAGDGYYANSPVGLDPTGNALEGNNARVLINWEDGYCNTFADSSYSACSLMPRRDVVNINGNRASYIIFRLCNNSGVFSDTGVNCARGAGASGGAGGAVLSGTECQGALSYENPDYCHKSGSESAVLYRILVRTVGPRNTVSYTETLAYF